MRKESRQVIVSLLVISLYMLNTERNPLAPLNRIAVMLLCIIGRIE